MGRAARSETFEAGEVCIVHAIQRCVRRAYLTGVDEKTGRDYSHRREWIRRRMEALASVFGIDVLTYAIMSNHLHVILRNRPDVVARWTDQQVALRWLRVFPGRRLDEQLAEPTEADVKSLASQKERLQEIRRRLSDISWFMRALSEPIARLANKQDECTGRFWEGRFKAQRIADEAGLLACSMYVDLNPIRAAMAQSPEQAEHTSVYDRIRAEQGAQIPSAALDLVAVSSAAAAEEIKTQTVSERKQRRRSKRRNPTGRRILRDGWLAPLSLGRKLSDDPQMHREGFRASDKGFLHLSQEDYVTLLRWTAKPASQAASQQPAQVISASPAIPATRSIPAKLQSIFSSLGIDGSMWRDLVWNYKRYFGRSSCAGSPGAMSADALRTGHRFHHGQRQVAKCFAAA